MSQFYLIPNLVIIILNFPFKIYMEEKLLIVLNLCFSCLPSDLEGAVWQSSQASALFVSSGGMRAIVCARLKCNLFNGIWNHFLRLLTV